MQQGFGQPAIQHRIRLAARGGALDEAQTPLEGPSVERRQERVRINL
jgi:hypothetical protein